MLPEVQQDGKANHHQLDLRRKEKGSEKYLNEIAMARRLKAEPTPYLSPTKLVSPPFSSFECRKKKLPMFAVAK